MNKYLNGYNVNIEVKDSILWMQAIAQGRLFELRYFIDDFKYMQTAIELGFVFLRRALRKNNLLVNI